MKAKPDAAAPAKAEARLCARLDLTPEQSRAFIEALHSGSCSRRAIVLSPLAGDDYQPPFPCEDRTDAPWLPPRVRIPQADVRPAAYDDYSRGLYYILDLSSCWESAALSCVPCPRRSLDLCAAPGGKTMLLCARYRDALPAIGKTAPLGDNDNDSRLKAASISLPGDLDSASDATSPEKSLSMDAGIKHAVPLEHIANEVSPSRRGILRQNLEQCGLGCINVTGLRPDQWRDSNESFDLLLIDAPCSGQSLLAKGIANPGCLGPSAVNGNAKRQKGILLAAVGLVRPGGHILYSTCTYDPDENEKVMAYVLRRIPGWEAVDIPPLDPFRSTLCDFAAYRLLPMHGFGAGGFCCLLKKRE